MTVLGSRSRVVSPPVTRGEGSVGNAARAVGGLTPTLLGPPGRRTGGSSGPEPAGRGPEYLLRPPPARWRLGARPARGGGDRPPVADAARPAPRLRPTGCRRRRDSPPPPDAARAPAGPRAAPAEDSEPRDAPAVGRRRRGGAAGPGRLTQRRGGRVGA